MTQKKVDIINNKNTPIISLHREVNWQTDEPPFIPEKDKNSSVRFGVISGERLYRGLDYEGEMIFLTETNWQFVLKYQKLDFILIESCLETATGDWSMVQTDPDFKNSELHELIQTAKENGISTIYWFTLDQEYHELFSPITAHFDHVFCADPQEVEKLSRIGVKADTLLPAVQPAIYNGITEYSGESVKRIPGVCDGLVDIIQSWSTNKDLYKNLSDFGIKFFDSANQIWYSKVASLEISEKNLLGTISFDSRLALLKRANVYCDFSTRTTTKTARLWQVMEAAACRLPVIIYGKLDEDDIMHSFVHTETVQDFFLIELVRHKKDEIYREKRAQKSWRKIVKDHTFSHRFQTICNKLGLNHDWDEWPSAALVTPSYRTNFFERAKQSFENMNYPNKEWVFVFNGSNDDYLQVKQEVSKIKNSKAIYVPLELHAGACMNEGFQHAESEYVFRMDDDDYYGENYLLDSMLYTRSTNISVSGKNFKFFVLTNEYPETLFSRNSKVLNFSKPAFIDSSSMPNHAILCGATQWGLREYMLENPYPLRNYGAVDSQWLDSLRENKSTPILVLDDLNIVVDRRLDGSHTWLTEIDDLMINANSYVSSIEEVCRT